MCVYFEEDADIVDIRYDKAFKAVFTKDNPRTRRALGGLLSACVGKNLSVVSLSANEPAADAAWERHIRYDVVCRLDGGEAGDVEMTLCPEPDETFREEYYAARLFTVQDIRGGDSAYLKLKNVYQVNILANGIRYGQDDEIVHRFGFYDWEHNLNFEGRMHIISVELAKAEKTAREKGCGDMSAAESWAVFLRYHAEKGKRELVNGLLMAKEDIAMAARNMLEFTEKEREWFRNESRLKYELDMKRTLYYAKQAARKTGLEEGMAKGMAEGREEGLAEGMAEGEEKARARAEGEKLESARKMKNAGLSSARIREFLGLSEEEIEKL
jgi:predicted transposase/invertase (TIGR01784 family)